MRYFVPELVFPTGEQVEFVEKFGGNPWGLPQERWPLCADCGKPLTHLFSLQHHSERLDLGREGRQVLVFQCNHDPGMCETWSASSGANAVLFLEPEDSTHAITIPPEPLPEPEMETWVSEWETRDDGVDPTEYDAYFNDQRLMERYSQEEDWESVFGGTKLGSVPNWIQSASEAPPTPFRFVGQFDMQHEVVGYLPESIDRTNLYLHESEGRTRIEAANYGDVGRAYLFINLDGPVPLGAFFWQCG